MNHQSQTSLMDAESSGYIIQPKILEEKRQCNSRHIDKKRRRYDLSRIMNYLPAEYHDEKDKTRRLSFIPRNIRSLLMKERQMAILRKASSGKTIRKGADLETMS